MLHAVLGALLIPEAHYSEIVVRGAGKPGATEEQEAAWIACASVEDHALVAGLPPLHRGEREELAAAEDHLLRWRPKTPWAARPPRATYR